MSHMKTLSTVLLKKILREQVSKTIQQIKIRNLKYMNNQPIK